MRDLLTAGLLIAALVALLGFVLGGRRADRAGFKDPISGLGRPSSSYASFTLGVLALAGIVAFWEPPALTPTMGIMIGVTLGLLIDLTPVHLALEIVGVVASVAAAVQYLSKDTGTAETLVFRIALVALLTASYAAGAIVGVLFLHRSARTFAFGKGRGLTFFGLVDTFIFFAGPGGADVVRLSPRTFFTYLAVAVGSALLLGMLAGQVTLVVTGIAVTITTLALPLTGISADPTAMPTAVFFLVAVIAYAVLRAASTRLPWRK